MKISVITVCYNSEHTLERSLKSVASQDWPAIEHIVIDGGSTDNTNKILEHYSSCLAFLVSEPDNGIYDAMNKGLKNATGDIICFLNSDDQYSSNDVLTRVASQMENYKLDAIFGDVGFFHKTNSKHIVRHYRSNFFSPSKLSRGWMPAHPTLFLRKEVVQRVGQFKTTYSIAADFEYIVRVFYGQEVRYKYLPEILVHMQTGGISTSGWRAKIKINKEILRACQENGLQTNMLKILTRYPAKLLEFTW